MRTTSFETTISMEHIHPDLVDVPVTVSLEVYRGSTSGLSSDDPSEVSIIEVTASSKWLKGIPVVVDDNIYNQIMEAYER